MLLSTITKNERRHIREIVIQRLDKKYSGTTKLFLEMHDIAELKYLKSSRIYWWVPWDRTHLKCQADFRKEIRREQKALLQLKAKKWIDLQKKTNKYKIILTSSGIEEMLRRAIINQTEQLPSNAACYVIFDIPEKERQLRSELRCFLRQAKFEMIQRSVWRSRKNIFNLLHQLFHISSNHEWITVIYGQTK